MDCILKEPTGLSGENRFERGGEMHAGEQPEDPAVVLARDAEHWAQRGEWSRRVSTGCIMSAKSLLLSGPPFPHLRNGNDNAHTS